MRFTGVSLQKRGAAFLMDCLIFYFVIFIPYFSALMFSMGIYEPSLDIIFNETIMSGLSAGLGIIFLFFMFYKSSFEYVFSQTPGKYFFKIKVEGVSSFGKSLLRNIVFLFPPLIFFDVFSLIVSDQRFFEKITNTQVLNSNMEKDKK